MPSIAFLTVTYNSMPHVLEALDALEQERRDGDEVILVDNASGDGTPAAIRDRFGDSVRVIDSGANLGFSEGCNLAASRARADLLVFLNPDAIVQPGFRTAIERPARDGRGWGAWMGLVTADGGATVNTEGGALHFTGIAWAGGAGRALGDGEPPAPREVSFLSGACLAIPRSAFERLGGFPARYFLYHEDVDLSLRLRLAGERIGIEPAARVDHDYEFLKGSAKWRGLERNRLATLIRTYPAGLLAVLAPALLATELALLIVAARGGWLREKLGSWADVLKDLPRLAGERRVIQRERVIGAGEFARALSPDLDSAYLGAAGRSRLLRAGLRAYWSLALALLGSRPQTGQASDSRPLPPQ